MLRRQSQCGAFSLRFGLSISLIGRRIQGGADRRKHRDRHEKNEEQFYPLSVERGHVFLWFFLRLLPLHTGRSVTTYRGCYLQSLRYSSTKHLASTDLRDQGYSGPPSPRHAQALKEVVGINFGLWL